MTQAMGGESQEECGGGMARVRASHFTNVDHPLVAKPRVHGLKQVEVVRGVNAKPGRVEAVAGPGVGIVLPARGDVCQPLAGLARRRQRPRVAKPAARRVLRGPAQNEREEDCAAHWRQSEEEGVDWGAWGRHRRGAFRRCHWQWTRSLPLAVRGARIVAHLRSTHPSTQACHGAVLRPCMRQARILHVPAVQGLCVLQPGVPGR